MKFTPHHPRPWKGLSGFSLIESLIAVLLCAILADITLPALSRWTDQYRLRGAAEQLLADLQLVRTEAAARQQSLRWSLRPWTMGSCYVLHSGPADACDCGSGDQNTPAICKGGALALKTVRWSGREAMALKASAPSILFDPVDGTATPASTLEVRNPHQQSLRHMVNIMGRVRTCSPQGLVPIYPSC